MPEVGEIYKKDYDRWRYHYPEFNAAQKRENVMPQGLSDILIETFIERR